MVAVAFHAFAEQPWRLEGLDPALREQAAGYVAAVAGALPPERRHQELHRGHLIELTLPQDEAIVTAANVARFSLTGTAAELRERAAALAADGVTELAIQPGGDVPAELRRPRVGPARLTSTAWTAPPSPRCSPTGASPPTAPARRPRPSAPAPTAGTR